MALHNISSVSQLKLQQQANLHKVGSNGDFSEAFKAEASRSQPLQFSKHALARMNERGVTFSETLSKELSAAVDKAREKGAKDVVVIGPQSAFIVNIPNNTVITTMSALEMRENIFTNIDSAVIL